MAPEEGAVGCRRGASGTAEVLLEFVATGSVTLPEGTGALMVKEGKGEKRREGGVPEGYECPSQYL